MTVKAVSIASAVLFASLPIAATAKPVVDVVSCSGSATSMGPFTAGVSHEIASTITARAPAAQIRNRLDARFAARVEPRDHDVASNNHEG
jgi:hypothetical protein